MFHFRIKKAFDFLRLNESDPLKVLILNSFNISDLNNLLLQKFKITNNILTPNITNTLNIVNTYLITTKSRAKYTFFTITPTLPKSNLLSARAEFKTTSKLTSILKLLIKNIFLKVLILAFTPGPLTTFKLIIIFLKPELELIL